MRRRIGTLAIAVAAIVAATAATPPAHAQGFGPLQPPAHAGPFDALPPTTLVPRTRTPRAHVSGVRLTVGAFPPTGVADPPKVQDRSRHYALPGDPVAVRARERRVRVQLLRVTSTGRIMREEADRTVRRGRTTTLRLPRLEGAHHELRLTAGGRTNRTNRNNRSRRLYLYTPANGEARAFLAQRTLRPGDALRGEVVITGDAVLSGGACGAIQELRDGRWSKPRTETGFACILVLVTFAPGERFPLGFADLPEDLPAGRYRYIRRFHTQLDARPVEATAEFDVVRDP